MEALREVIRPEGGQVIVELPEDWGTTEVEVIVLPIRSASSSGNRDAVTQFRGALKTGLTPDEIRDECLRMRNEWNRTA